VALRDASIVSVHKRRSSRDGLWLGSPTPLREVGTPLSSIVRAEALKAGYPSNPEMKVFGIEGSQPDEAVVCWTSWGGHSWPNSLEGALSAPSTLDFYHCNRVQKLADRWVVQVQ
jgi:hypothetical protein